MNLFIATVETRHFTFEGVGASEQEAREALQRGLVVHAEQYRLAPDWYAGAIDPDDVSLREVATGGAYRDREPLSRSKVQA